jgi:hypothetical protein
MVRRGGFGVSNTPQHWFEHPEAGPALLVSSLKKRVRHFLVPLSAGEQKVRIKNMICFILFLYRLHCKDFF